MVAWSVNHCPLDVWRRQTVKIRVRVQGCEVLEKGFEVLVGIFNILQNNSRQSRVHACSFNDVLLVHSTYQIRHMIRQSLTPFLRQL